MEFSLWAKYYSRLSYKVNLHWITKWREMHIHVYTWEIAGIGSQVEEVRPSWVASRRLTPLL
jgi:hypothetical protein